MFDETELCNDMSDQLTRSILKKHINNGKCICGRKMRCSQKCNDYDEYCSDRGNTAIEIAFRRIFWKSRAEEWKRRAPRWRMVMKCYKREAIYRSKICVSCHCEENEYCSKNGVKNPRCKQQPVWKWR